MGREDRKKLYSFVEVDDSVPIQKLSILDQFRILLKHLSYDAANELKSEDAITTEYMTLKANLSDFLYKSTDAIRRGNKKEVIVNVSNVFDPVFEEVINSPEIKNYFTVSVVRPKIDYDIPFDFMVKLRVKES